ncbi:hypothetical protein WOLCODRAFT_164399 [Wolfiporia cocos MD-104 SS10]|uniref:Uncharacterized protein n=1 Tax=Wolfiporia cocos (strain MD-104) TaxID=742152 RepID=A0A2H3JZT2_WOLCO|nr:hypothetical protein WOLCODRAFT_164399 [Wolfiporia cocos MD-104 SS10]
MACKLPSSAMRSNTSSTRHFSLDVVQITVCILHAQSAHATVAGERFWAATSLATPSRVLLRAGDAPSVSTLVFVSLNSLLRVATTLGLHGPVAIRHRGGSCPGRYVCSQLWPTDGLVGRVMDHNRHSHFGAGTTRWWSIVRRGSAASPPASPGSCSQRNVAPDSGHRDLSAFSDIGCRAKVVS